MNSNVSERQYYIEVNDIFDELSDENKRLKNELMFANNCLNVLINFKILLSKVLVKFETIIDSENKEEFKQLEEDFNVIINSEEQLKTKPNEEISDEINRSVDKNAEEVIKDKPNEITGNSDDINVEEVNGSADEKTDPLNINRDKAEETPKKSVRKRCRYRPPVDTIVRRSGRTDRIVYQFNRKRMKRPKTVPIKAVPTVIPEPEEEPNSLLLMRRNNFDAKTQTYVCPNPSCNKSYITNRKLYDHFCHMHHMKRESDRSLELSTNSLFDIGMAQTSGHQLYDSEDPKDLEVFNPVTDSPYQISKQINSVKTEVFDQIADEIPVPAIKRSRGRKRKIYHLCSYEGCGKRFTFNCQLKRHIQITHTMEKPFKCLECNKGFIAKFMLRDHQLTHSGLGFECEVCHKVIFSEKGFNNHKKNHALNRMAYYCSYCRFETKRADHLRSHIKMKHVIKDKTVECDYKDCHKLFKDIKLMKDHKFRVHRNVRVLCDWPGCGQSYKSKFYASEHFQTHLGVRAYKCDLPGCAKTFTHNRKLAAHKRYHQKRYICSWPACSYRFATKNLLSEHMNRHQNIKPFKCTFNGCSKEYFSKLSLRFHLQSLGHKNDKIVKSIDSMALP